LTEKIRSLLAIGTLAIAVVALAVGTLSPGPPGPIGPQGPPGASSFEIEPPRVDLIGSGCPGVPDCLLVQVVGVTLVEPTWRFTVTLHLRETQLIDPPVHPMRTGNLWVSIWSGTPSTHLNFSDTDNDGLLSIDDAFFLDHLTPGQWYSFRLLWAASGAQLQHVTFRL
jgi:hypothetical protein